MSCRLTAVVAPLAPVFLATAVAVADVKPHGLFTDNTVLQREAAVNVWGAADPGEAVTVTMAGQSVKDTADTAGRWGVRLAPMKAGGPFELTIAGKNTVVLKNVMVGEVWICAGQSNMEMAVASARNGQAEVAGADHPDIRLFTVPAVRAPEPQQDGLRGAWAVSSPRTVRAFSAVGYFFARDLQKAIKVPIGLIDTSRGGTAIQWWSSREALASDRRLAGEAAALDRVRAEMADHEARLAEWTREAAAARAAGNEPTTRPAPPRSARQQYPAGLYNGAIHPLIRYRIAGVIWYQGEANAWSRAHTDLYAVLFPAMIRDWRAKWGYEFPFLFVQLPNYRKRAARPDDPPWARLREVQRRSLALPGTGMAVTIDVGEADNLHPPNKQDVGKRLALAARAIAYGEKDLVYSGPMYESMTVEGGAIRLTFTHVGGGLAAKGGTLTGFAIAGEDKQFVWADAKIDGDTVIVRSEAVKEPVAVRYAWGDNPDCNLTNTAGLPASPFRTDDW